MEFNEVLGALIGLAGAVNNNGRTADTDAVVRRALAGQASADEIRREKYAISPGCETCPNPCGNTSDCDMERLRRDGGSLTRARHAVLDAIRSAADMDGPLPDAVYHALAAIGWSVQPVFYEDILKELQDSKEMKT